MKKPSLQQRLKAKNRSQSLIVAVTWYTEETWVRVKNNATDPECFEDSFSKWEATAVKARREFQRSGVRAIECRIIPEEFFEWCTQNNQANNSTSRAEFVSAKLTEALETKA
jgi:hypothetical protein